MIRSVIAAGACCALLAASGCGSDGDGTGPDNAAGDTSQLVDGGDASQSPDGGPEDDVDLGVETRATFVEIVTPVHDQVVTHAIRVALRAVDHEELAVDAVTLKVNGVTVRTDTKLPTEFVLDTREHEPGPLRLEAYAQKGFDNGSHALTVRLDNPPIAFLAVTPESRFVQDGQVISVLAEIDGPPSVRLSADFSNIDSNYVPGSEASYLIGEGVYAVSYVMSADNTVQDGTYRVPITATAADWTVTYGLLDMSVRNRPAAPIRIAVQRGIFVDEDLPQPSANWDPPTPTITSENNYVVTGGSAQMDVDYAAYASPEQIIGLIIGIEGHAGYFQVPIPASGGTIPVQFQLRAYEEYEVVPEVLPMRVAMRDVTGRVSRYGAVLYNIAPVGSGDIQVSVAWDTPTDIDLHVVDPVDCETYYGNKTGCSSGAELDLDSNAGCSIDGVNNENVFWPAGQAPIGTYTVRVDFWSDCDDVGANYVVTMNYCGKTEIHEGSFDVGDDNHGGSGDGRTVATFSNAVCQTSIRGRIRYEDRTFDEGGFGAFEWRPVRNAVVQLRRLSDNAVLGEAATNENGDYLIGFTNDGPPGVVVVVKAETDADEGLRDIKVLDHPKFKKLYEVSSTPVVFQSGQDLKVQDIDIPVGLNAGAFNIFDVVQRGYDLVRRMTGQELGELIAFWKTGSDTTETLFCSTYLYDTGVCTERGSVSVQGKDTDRDEYDDMVILKEFFKFALERQSRDDHPGGAVDGTRDEPARSWSEGVTTFFANDVLNTRYFVNSQPAGVYLVDDVEGYETPFAYRTEDGTKSAALSPFLVTSILWDLADAQDLEAFDSISGRDAGIYDVLFNYLSSEDYVDRGAPGVDFVDFLDGWFCRGWGDRDQVETLLVDHRQFPYDFAGPTGCIQP